VRRLRTSLLGAAAGFAILLSGTASSNAASTPQATSTPQSVLQAAAQVGVSRGYPGVMGMVVDGDTTTYFGAGSSTPGGSAPMDPNAKYRIASNTKTFTATVVLQLAAEGRLSLDDTVAKWLPNAVNANGHDGRTITIRQSLNQTSGLPEYVEAYGIQYYGNTNVHSRVRYTPQELVDTALRQSPAGVKKFGYANTNYILAGMIIKTVTGNTAAVEITNRLITPLGLTGTSMPEYDPNIYGNFIHGWWWPPAVFGWQPPIQNATVSNVEMFGASGAIISTMRDQVVFERALLQGQLLPPAQMAELTTTVPIPNTVNTYGLALTLWKLQCGDGKFVWSHGGDAVGYHSRWFASADGTKQVLYMANEHHGVGGTPGKTVLIENAQIAMCMLLG
jgi:D-alanyl-D-alanine carboxypeptidase